MAEIREISLLQWFCSRSPARNLAKMQGIPTNQAQSRPTPSWEIPKNVGIYGLYKWYGGRDYITL